MKFDPVELERVVERSLRPPAPWQPPSHQAVRFVEAAAFGTVLGYWLLALVGVFA